MRLFKLIVNDKQLIIIQDSLESYSRLGIGQLENVLNNLGFRTYEQFKDNFQEFHSEEVNKAIHLLKRKLFSLSSNASNSIENSNIHENFKIAYDIFSSIKNKLIGDCKINIYSNNNKISNNGIMEIEVVKEKEDVRKEK